MKFYHIVNVVGEQAKVKGYKKVLITGTKWLINSNIYNEIFDKEYKIEIIKPELNDINIISDIIMDELVHGILLCGI